MKLINIDPKALEHACQCAGRAVHHFDRMALDLPLRASIIAHARAIEQHEAFRQEVSDAITGFDEYGTEAAWEKLSRFIIAKPDPLVEAMQEWWDADGYANIETFRAVIRKRGGKIVWGEEQ